MAKAIEVADNSNLNKIRKVYPQMVAAFESANRDEPPKGYEPGYEGERINDAATQVQEEQEA